MEANISEVRIIETHEHANLCMIESIVANRDKFCKTEYESIPKHLGIDPYTLSASYYIGADWLTENDALIIMPKIHNLDFIQLFITALDNTEASMYFSKFYGIDFSKKRIKTNAFNNNITPLLVIHYLSLLKRLTQKGLKKGYIIREENLQSKIKGKIKFDKHVKQNVLLKKENQVYCQYQEYSVDCCENRLLKKALLFCKQYITKLINHSSYRKIQSTINLLLVDFQNVGIDVSIRQIKKVVPNKIYKDYIDTVPVAKMLLKFFEYSISSVTEEKYEIQPFWIDMSRLYEVYVYSKLKEVYHDSIKFQVAGYYKTAVDFIKVDEQIVIDTKYKPQYSEGNRGIIEDIRQVSAYARDRKILNNFEDNTHPKCLIIYPEKLLFENQNELEKNEDYKDVVNFDSSSILENASPISAFDGFYKLSIPLPSFC